MRLRPPRRPPSDALPLLALAITFAAACAAAPLPDTQPVIVSTEAKASPVPSSATPDDPDASAARQAALDLARESGILGLLTEGDADAGRLATIFGTDSALGDAGIGAMFGDELGEAFGAGGLGLVGTGPGGGGTGEGIGLGSIGTIGRGAGPGTGSGYGSGSGRLGGRKETQVRPGAATVQGSLDKEVIRAVVRRQTTALRFCYEQGLSKDPKLQGRVSTKFTIGKDGAVTSAETSGDMPDPSVRDCVRKVFQRMSFPKPDPPGVVVVSYPLVFAPAEDSAAPSP